MQLLNYSFTEVLLCINVPFELSCAYLTNVDSHCLDEEELLEDLIAHVTVAPSRRSLFPPWKMCENVDNIKKLKCKRENEIATDV